jgi:hypothetical protein
LFRLDHGAVVAPTELMRGGDKRQFESPSK